MSLADWSAGKGGVWEWMTTADGRIFYDEGEAIRHHVHDIDGLGDRYVRPFGSSEWGFSARGRRMP